MQGHMGGSAVVVRAKGKQGTAAAAQILRGEGGPQAVGQGELE